MKKAIVVYYSRSGNTKDMAGLIAQGIEKGGVDVDIRKVQEISADDLLKYEAIVVGSPTYYGTMAAQIKKMWDDSVKFHGSLDGKIGAAFSSSANVGGGNETTILDILNAMLIHGMVIQGDPQGDHYGVVSVGPADSRVKKQCMRMGERIARLMKG